MRTESVVTEGVIGLASDLIRVDSQFGHLADYLLGRVFIVDHIDYALALAKNIVIL